MVGFVGFSIREADYPNVRAMRQTAIHTPMDRLRNS
jgi:hypothetical protein